MNSVVQIPKVDQNDILDKIEILYANFNRPMPEVKEVRSPMDAFEFFSILDSRYISRRIHQFLPVDFNDPPESEFEYTKFLHCLPRKWFKRSEEDDSLIEYFDLDTQGVHEVKKITEYKNEYFAQRGTRIGYFYRDLFDYGNKLANFLDNITNKSVDQLPPYLKSIYDICQIWSSIVPLHNVCILVQKPILLSLNSDNKLHNTDGPSIEWSDGFSYYHVHGQEVHWEWVEHKDILSPKYIFSHDRSKKEIEILTEIIGWNKIVEKQIKKGKTYSKVIDTNPDPEIGQLIKVRLGKGFRRNFLRCRCGTGREVYLPVPSNVKTALEANAWTYDIPVKTLKRKETRT